MPRWHPGSRYFGDGIFLPQRNGADHISSDDGRGRPIGIGSPTTP